MRIPITKAFYSIISGILILIILLLIFIIHKDIQNTKIKILGDNDNFIIKNWTIIGPFYSDFVVKSNTLNKDELKIFGLSEDSLTLNDFRFLINQVKRSSDKTKVINYKGKNETIDLFNLYKNPDRSHITNSYMICTVESPVEQEIMVLSSCSYGSKIWINQQLISSVYYKRYLEKIYEEYHKVKLKKGKNFILVKVNCRNIKTSVIHWKFTMAITGEGYAKNNFKTWYYKDFLTSGVIKEGDSLSILLGAYKWNLPVSIKITDLNDKEIYSYKIVSFNNAYYYNSEPICTFPLPKKMDTGFYHCRLILPDETLVQEFFYGDIDKQDTFYLTQLKAFGNSLNENDSINFITAVQRFNYLITYKKEANNYEVDYNFPFDKRFLNRNRVSSGMYLDYYFKKILYNQPLEGMQFRGFRSKIDESIQQYMLYIPDKLKQSTDPIPALIIIPYEPSDSLKMFNAWYSLNLNQFDIDLKLADKYGFALIYVWMRGGRERTNIIGFNDVFEVLENVKGYYNIDNRREFLTGVCLGAKRAAMLASRYPDKFTGVWLYTPEENLNILSRSKDTWDYSQEPLNFFGNLKNNEIYIYSSKDDEVVPIKSVDKYYRQAQKNNINVIKEYIQGISHFRYPLEHKEHAFEIYSTKTNELKPKEIFYITDQLKFNKSYWLQILGRENNDISKIEGEVHNNNVSITTDNVSALAVYKDYLPLDTNRNVIIKLNNKVIFNDIFREKKFLYKTERFQNNSKSNLVEGPILHAFSDRFIVVKGTQKVSSLPSIDSCIITLNRKWMKKNVSSCIIKLDTLINADDIRTSNLILVGNSEENIICKTLISQLPLNIYTDSLKISHRLFKGKDLNYSFIYPNPLNNSKYIVLIGSNNSGKLNINHIDFFNKGSFDYYIWNFSFNDIENGFFDNHWELN